MLSEVTYWDGLCCSVWTDVVVLWPFSWSALYYMIGYRLGDMVIVWRLFCWDHFKMSLELLGILWVQHVRALAHNGEDSGTQWRRFRQRTDATRHIVTMQCQWVDRLIHCGIWWWRISWKLNLSGRFLSDICNLFWNQILIWVGCVHVCCDCAYASFMCVSHLFCSVSKCWLG